MAEEAEAEETTEGRSSRAWRWVRRGLLVAGYLLAALLLFVVAGGLWLQHRGNVAGDRALAELRKRGLPTRLSALSAPVEDEQAARRAASYFAAAGKIARHAFPDPRYEGKRTGGPRLGVPVDAALAADLEDYVAAHRQVYELVETARGRPEYFYDFQFHKEDSCSSRVMSSLWSVADALAVRSLLRQSSGHGDAALRDCAATLEICRSLDNDPWLITRGTRIRVGAVAVEGIEQTLSRTTSGVNALSELRKRCLSESEAFDLAEPLRREFAAVADRIRQPKRHGLKLMWQGQEALASDMLDERPPEHPEGIPTPAQQVRQVLPVPFSLLPVRTGYGLWLDVQNLVLIVCPAYYETGLARGVDIWLSYYDEATRGGEDLAAMARDAGALSSGMEWLGGEERDLLRELRAGYARNVIQQVAARARMSVAAAALAVEAHYRRQGRWPESLSEAGVEEPEDPLGDGPLAYRQTSEGRKVYSVGQNGIDDGGVEDYSQDADDIVFTLLDADRRGALPSQEGERARQ